MKECVKCAKGSLYLTHKEPDSRMTFHLNSITNPAKVVIWTSDTDVFPIALDCIIFLG